MSPKKEYSEHRGLPGRQHYPLGSHLCELRSRLSKQETVGPRVWHTLTELTSAKSLVGCLAHSKGSKTDRYYYSCCVIFSERHAREF